MVNHLGGVLCATPSTTSIKGVSFRILGICGTKRLGHFMTRKLQKVVSSTAHVALFTARTKDVIQFIVLVGTVRLTFASVVVWKLTIITLKIIS
jgi:hypothetical protein